MKEMMKRKLIVSGGEKFPDIDTSKFEAFKYIIGNGEEYSKNYQSLNNSNRFNQLSRDLRDEYTEWVYQKNQLFIDYNIIYQNDLSLYFFSDFSNKRIKLFNTYQDICNIELIIEQVINHKINNIQ